MRWAGHVTRMGEKRGAYRVLVGKPEGKRPLGRPKHRWVDNIRMDLQDVGCGYMDWIELDQDRDRCWTFVSAVMNLRVPWNAGNFLTSCKPVSFSRRTLHHEVSKYSLHVVTRNFVSVRIYQIYALYCILLQISIILCLLLDKFRVSTRKLKICRHSNHETVTHKN